VSAGARSSEDACQTSRLSEIGFFGSKASGYFGASHVRALFEAAYFPGWRKARPGRKPILVISDRRNPNATLSTLKPFVVGSGKPGAVAA
jgi:hypothetical protein